MHKSSKWDYRFSAGISLLPSGEEHQQQHCACAVCSPIYVAQHRGICSTFLISKVTSRRGILFFLYIFIWLLLLLLQSRVVWCLFLYPILYSCWLAGCWDDYFVIIIQLMNADNPVGVNRPSIQRPCRLLLCCVCPIAPDVVNLIHETPCPLLSSFCRTRLYDVCVCLLL